MMTSAMELRNFRSNRKWIVFGIVVFLSTTCGDDYVSSTKYDDDVTNMNITRDLRIDGVKRLCEQANWTAKQIHRCYCEHEFIRCTMDHECRRFEFAISVVFVGITVLFGFVGNVLSVLTLRRDAIKSVTTFLLSALAMADFAFLVPAIFVIMLPTYCEYYVHCAHRLTLIIPHFEQYGWAIASTCHSCTVYITVLVAIHRYLWVCRPELAHTVSGLNRVKIQVAFVPLCALIYNSPRFFEYRVVWLKYNATDTIRTETIKELTTIGANQWFQILYKNVCFFVIMYVIPLAILIFVSVKLIRTLQQRRVTLQRIGSTNSTASHSRRDDNITLVLIVIIAAFIVCQTPTMLQRLILPLSGKLGHTCGHIYFYLEHIADYMALLNSATNFVIYILFSPHFRHTLKAEVICKSQLSGASIALRLSRFSRSRKTYDEKNALCPRESVRSNNTAQDGRPSGSGTAGERTRDSRSGENQQRLTLPDLCHQMGSSSNSHSLITSQATTQEMLSSYTADDVDRDEGVIRHMDSSLTTEDNDLQVQVPLIAVEEASSTAHSVTTH